MDTAKKQVFGVGKEEVSSAAQRNPPDQGLLFSAMHIAIPTAFYLLYSEIS